MDEPKPDNKPTTPVSDNTASSPSSGSDPVTDAANTQEAPTDQPAHPEGIAPPTPGQVVSAGEYTPTTPTPQASSSAEPAPTANTTSQPVTPSIEPDTSVSSGSTAKVVASHHGGSKRWLRVVLLLIIVALLAAGGWLAYQKHRDNSKSANSAAQSKSISLLKIGISQGNYGSTLYPDMSVNEYSYLTNAQMFEGLVRYENKSKVVPDLASTWTNPDSKTWLFTVKSGVQFHDGHTLTAQDVKYSLDKVITSNSDLAQTFASTIASVDVVGNNQVKITTTAPDPALLNRLAFLYIIDANLPKGDEPSQAGTGPYEIKPGTQPTDTNVQMVAFNDYHGGQPTTKALDFGAADDPTTLVKDFQAHKYNIVGPIPLDDAKKVKPATEFITSEPDVNYLGFNTVKPGPLQNKLVREAIRYAVNPVAIGKSTGRQVTPISQLIPESIPGYNPSIMPYKQDIAKAKQLLTQAGYPNGVTIRFSTTADPKEVAEIVSELKQAGITATVDEHSDFNEFINYFNSGQAEMFEVDYASDTLDGLDIYSTTLDAANYSNPQVTSLLDQANAATDPAKRLKLLQQAATIIDQDVAVVPLSAQNDVWLMDKPYAIQQDMPSSLLSVYFSKVQQK